MSFIRINYIIYVKNTSRMSKIIMTVDYWVSIVTYESMGQSPRLVAGCRHARRGRVFSRTRPSQCHGLTKHALVTEVNELGSFPFCSFVFLYHTAAYKLDKYCSNIYLPTSVTTCETTSSIYNHVRHVRLHYFLLSVMW